MYSLDLLDVTTAIYIADYKIYFEFSNNFKGVVDLKDQLNIGIFKELQDLDKFKDFRLNKEIGTIEWSNGADWSPGDLFLRMQEQLRENLHPVR